MAQQMKFCRKCGKKISADAKFCRYCGFKFDVTGSAPAPRESVVQSGSQAVPEPASMGNIADKIALENRFDASGIAGESPLGDFGLDEFIPEDIKEEIQKVASPVQALINTCGSFFGGTLKTFITPKTWIPLIIIAILWIVLPGMKDSDSPIVKALSFLTFAEGGFNRDAAGTIGGIIGKGTVAAALASVFTGGIPSAAKGLGSLFKGTGEKRGILALIIGIFIGFSLYFSFTDFELASGQTAMAGISGAFLSLQCIDKKEGPWYELAQALTSKVKDGVRMPRSGKAQSLLTGNAIGFVIAAAIMAL